MTHQSVYDKILLTGMNYAEFKKQMKQKVENTNPELLDEDERTLYNYRKLNLHRTSRIDKVYHVPEGLASIIHSIDKPQLWMILTEDWCGDSAQNIPYIVKMAEQNSLITLGFVERDKNPDIMDLYLTNGTKAIPKLIAFDENGYELFQWGPRPTDVQSLVIQWKKSGMAKNEFAEKLHLWYASNRGKSLEQDFFTLLCHVAKCREAS